MNLTDNLKLDESFYSIAYRESKLIFEADIIPKYIPLNLVYLWTGISTLRESDKSYFYMKIVLKLIIDVLNNKSFNFPLNSGGIFGLSGAHTYKEFTEQLPETSSAYSLMIKNYKRLGAGAYCFFNTSNYKLVPDYYYYLGVETEKLPEVILSLMLGKTIKSEYLKFFINNNALSTYKFMLSHYKKVIKPALLKDNIEIIESDNINDSLYTIKYPQGRIDNDYFTDLIRQEWESNKIVNTPIEMVSESTLTSGIGIMEQIQSNAVYTNVEFQSFEQTVEQIFETFDVESES